MTRFVSFELPSETVVDKTADNKIQEIFNNYMSKQSLFKNREVLSTNFLPNVIIHRDSEIQTVSSIIAPILKGWRLLEKVGTHFERNLD